MSGWIKLYRKIQDSPLYKQLNSKQRDVMINILLLASHESNEWEFGGVMYKVEPGQFITSIDAIQKKCASDVSVQNIRTSLAKLEKHSFLTNQPTNKNRLITVLNWALYQGESQQTTNKQINKQLTSKPTNKKTPESHTEQGVLGFDEEELTSKLNQNQQANVSETNNYKERRSKEDKEKEINTFSAYTTNADLQEALISFVESRKSMKKKMTEKAVTLLLKNLDKLGKDDSEKIAILEQSIVNGWQGIFELKGQTTRTAPTSRADRNKNLIQEVYHESIGSIEIVRPVYGSLPDGRNQ